jgi:hypothetical protein
VPASAKTAPRLDAITVGPNSNLWFTETAANRIGEITPKAAGPVIHQFELPAADRLGQGVGSSITSADTIATGPDDDIWFTEQGSNAIGVMNTSGVVVAKFTLPNSNLNPDPLGITEGPDDTMWFTENAANQVASITTAGKIRVYALPGAAAGPGSIVYGPDGNLWFTDYNGVGDIYPVTGKVTLYPAHTASSSPVGITVGPGCTSVWFTEPGADRLRRVSPIPNTNLNEFRDALGATWPFLSDPDRVIQKDLDIKEFTDEPHDPMIPHTFVLEPGLKIFKVYNGYWYWGRPTMAELHVDLRAVFQKVRPDFDLASPGLKEAWERGDRDQFLVDTLEEPIRYTEGKSIGIKR